MAGDRLRSPALTKRGLNRATISCLILALERVFRKRSACILWPVLEKGSLPVKWFLVSVGLDPMGPTTASYISQPVGRGSPACPDGSNDSTARRQEQNKTPAIFRPESVALSLLDNLAYLKGMKAAYRFSNDVGTFGNYDRNSIRRRVSAE